MFIGIVFPNCVLFPLLPSINKVFLYHARCLFLGEFRCRKITIKAEKSSGHTVSPEVPTLFLFIYWASVINSGSRGNIFLEKYHIFSLWRESRLNPGSTRRGPFFYYKRRVYLRCHSGMPNSTCTLERTESRRPPWIRVSLPVGRILSPVLCGKSDGAWRMTSNCAYGEKPSYTKKPPAIWKGRGCDRSGGRKTWKRDVSPAR